MKLNVRRSLFALVVALILVSSLPMAGCTKLIGELGRAIDKTASTTAPAASPSAEAKDWSQWLADAEKNLPEKIPLEKLFAAAEYTDPTVSPDGKLVLYRHIRPQGSDDVLVRNMKTGMEATVPYPEGVNGIPYFMWSGDSRHVLFMIDNSGDEEYSIFSVDISSGKSQTLYSKKGVTAIVVTTDDADPNVIYFMCNERSQQYFDLYRCDISAGAVSLVMENPGYIGDWYFDRSGNLRAVKAMDMDGGERMLLRKSDASDGTAFAPGEWEEILHWAYEDVDSSGFYGFSIDGKRVFYTDSTGANTTVIKEMDLATRQVTVVDSDPVYDAASVWIDLKKDRITAVEYYKERGQWKALEDDIGEQLNAVQSIGSGDFGFTSSSSDDHYWLVYFDNDTDGRSYYYIDSWTGESTYLFHETPVLKQYDFAPMEPLEYEASDGLTIHGYATFPVGLQRKDLPMVLLVHGGPQSRDVWGFNQEVQWLANLGYMVLQVNFRGSTGYGKQFVRAGDKEWGGKMQQDLTDAVNWAVSQGYADKSRIAIMGGSYGGYAALAGAAFTPDTYACAIDMFGPSSLITLIENSPAYWEAQLNQLYQSIGNPDTDAEFLKSRSPLYSVDNIKIPILIAQGGNDVRVTRQEAEQIVSAMKARGLYVDYMYFPNAGHGFNTAADSLRFYSEAEDFLAEHIGGRASDTR